MRIQWGYNWDMMGYNENWWNFMKYLCVEATQIRGIFPRFLPVNFERSKTTHEIVREISVESLSVSAQNNGVYTNYTVVHISWMTSGFLNTPTKSGACWCFLMLFVDVCWCLLMFVDVYWFLMFVKPPQCSHHWRIVLGFESGFGGWPWVPVDLLEVLPVNTPGPEASVGKKDRKNVEKTNRGFHR